MILVVPKRQAGRSSVKPYKGRIGDRLRRMIRSTNLVPAKKDKFSLTRSNPASSQNSSSNERGSALTRRQTGPLASPQSPIETLISWFSTQRYPSDSTKNSGRTPEPDSTDAWVYGGSTPKSGTRRFNLQNQRVEGLHLERAILHKIDIERM